MFIVVDVHVVVVEVDAAVLVILVAAVGIGHGLVPVPDVVLSRITEPESHIGYRVVGLCTFQAPHSLLEAVFLDAIVEGFAVELVSRDAQNLRQPIRGEHDRRCPCETVEEKSCSRFVEMRFWC